MSVTQLISVFSYSSLIYVSFFILFYHTIDFAGFKYLVRSCPGLDKTEEDILKLFTTAAGSDNTRTAYVKLICFFFGRRQTSDFGPDSIVDYGFVRQ